MADAGQMRVRKDALRSQARRVDELAADADAARQAGQSVRLDTGAYGVLCAIVPPMIGGLQDHVTDVVRQAADSLLDSGAGLIASAKLYEAADEQAGRDVDAIEEAVLAALRRGRA